MMNRLTTVLTAVGWTVMVAATVLVITRYVGLRASGSATDRRVPLPSSPQELPVDAMKGALDAPLAIIEFVDAECPFCEKFAADTLPQLERDYVAPGTVAFALRHLPLPIHSRAWEAAEVLACSGRLKTLWRVHDQLLTTPRRSWPDDLASVGTANQAEGRDLRECLLQGIGAARVRADATLAAKLRIGTTPTFLVGRLTAGRLVVSEVVNGAMPYSDFRAAIERARAQAAVGR